MWTSNDDFVMLQSIVIPATRDPGTAGTKRGRLPKAIVIISGYRPGCRGTKCWWNPRYCPCPCQPGCQSLISPLWNQQQQLSWPRDPGDWLYIPCMVPAAGNVLCGNCRVTVPGIVSTVPGWAGSLVAGLAIDCSISYVGWRSRTKATLSTELGFVYFFSSSTHWNM